MPQLKVVSGPGAGQTLALSPGQTYALGRGADAQLSIPADQTLSRKHAEVADQGGQWVIRNLSQHGSLMSGEVFKDQRPLAPGVQFTIGGTTIVFVGDGGEGGDVPVGAGAGAAAGAAGTALAGAAGDALKQLPSGPVTIDGSQPGFPIGDLIKGGLSIVKANLMPSLAIFAPIALMVFWQILVTVVGFISSDIAGLLALAFLPIVGLVGLYSLAMPLVIANYTAGVKRYQETGEGMGLGALFKFDDLVGKYVVQIAIGIGFNCCFVPGFLMCLGLPIFLDNPQAGFVNALKGSLSFVKRNVVPVLVLLIVNGIFMGLGAILCGVGVVITYPAGFAVLWLAYECKREQIKAAAAEDGVSL